MSNPSVPLAALLAHPALADLTVLSDGNSEPAAIRVERVVARIALDGIDMAPHALLILLTPLEATGWRVDTVVRRANDAGASALVVASRSPLSTSASALARRLTLPVYGTDDPFTTGVVARELITASQAYATEMIMSVVHALQKRADDVEQLVALLSRAIGHPVHLIDASGRQILGSAPAPPLDSTVIKRMCAESTSVIPLSDRLLLIAVAISRGDASSTWLSAEAPQYLPADATAVGAALEAAAPAIGHRLAMDRLTDERDARLRAALLSELAEAADAPPPELRRRAIHAGWLLDGWHIGVRVNPQPAVDTVTRRSDVLAALSLQGLGFEVVEQNDGWAAWTSLESEPAAADVDRIAKAIRRSHRALTDTLPTSVGVGAAHRGSAGLIRSLAEANDAAKLAEARPASGHFVHIDQLGLAQLLLAWTRTDTFEPVARTLLAPLAGQPGALLHTLTAYLDAESSLVETAAVLGVHRNTVAGRISRIEALLGVQLRDPEIRLALHLACRVHTGDS